MALNPGEISAEELEVLLVMRSSPKAGRAIHNYARKYTDERADWVTSEPFTR